MDQDQRKAKEGKFKLFFEALIGVLNNSGHVRADGRRHGAGHVARAASAAVGDAETTAGSSTGDEGVGFISLRHLIEEATKALHEEHPDAPVPSEEYVRLQFLPRRPTARSADRHYGAIELKWGLQQR